MNGLQTRLQNVFGQRGLLVAARSGKDPVEPGLDRHRGHAFEEADRPGLGLLGALAALGARAPAVRLGRSRRWQRQRRGLDRQRSGLDRRVDGLQSPAIAQRYPEWLVGEQALTIRRESLAI